MDNISNIITPATEDIMLLLLPASFIWSASRTGSPTTWMRFQNLQVREI